MKNARWMCLALSTALSAALMAPAALAAEVQIEYWGVWGGIYRDIEQDIIDRFNELHEGEIEVTGMEVAGGPESKLPVAVAGGVPPAVAKLDRFQVGTFASKGLITPIDDLVRRDRIDPDDYWRATWEEAIYQGKLYGLPWNTDDRALYYNQTLFAASGLDPNRAPRTWKEVDQFADKLDRPQGNGGWAQIGFVPHWGNWYFVGWLWAAGGDLLDSTNRRVIWDSQEGLRALSWMQERLQHYGGASAVDRFSASYSDRHGALLGGGLAMQVDGSWAWGDINAYAKDFQFAVAPPPRPEGLENTPVTWSGGFALVIPQGVTGAQREAAWEFIKFYTSSWAQTELGSRSGQMPSLVSAARSREYLTQSRFLEGFVRLMDFSKFRPVIPAGDELWEFYVSRVHSLLTQGEMPAREILAETARLGQQALDEGWARAEQGM